MLVRYYSPHKGGNEGQCRLLSEFFAGGDTKVVVLTERYSGELKKKEVINQVEIIRLNSLNTFFNIGKVRSVNFLGKLFRTGFYYLSEFSLMFNIFLFLRLRKFRYDIIHIHQNNWIAYWGIIAVKKRIPVIIKDATLNGFNELRLMPLSESMRKKIIRNGKFVAVSSDIYINLIEYGVKGQNIFLIPNAAAVPSKINSYKNSEDIIFVGNFEQGKIKGLDTLINAMSIVSVQNKEAKLSIIGKGDPEPYLRMIEKNPLLKNRIQFYNQVDNISEYYLNAFMFVLPSRCEGMSNSLLEAMSYGMPCISTRVSGSNDLINSEK